MVDKSELEKVFLAFEAVHEKCFQGEADWGELARFYTDDVDYSDPGWGRMQGADRVEQFLRDSMAGLEDWDFPMRWYLIDPPYVVKKYSMVLESPRKADGSQYEVSGVYMMKYAGDGKFGWVEDQCNMSHYFDIVKNTSWKPGPGFNIPENVSWD